MTMRELFKEVQQYCNDKTEKPFTYEEFQEELDKNSTIPEQISIDIRARRKKS